MVSSFERVQNDILEQPSGSQKPRPAPRASRFDSASSASSSWVVMERAEALAAREATGVPMKAEADPKVRARTMAENCMIEMGLRAGRGVWGVRRTHDHRTWCDTAPARSRAAEGGGCDGAGWCSVAWRRQRCGSRRGPRPWWRAVVTEACREVVCFAGGGGGPLIGIGWGGNFFQILNLGRWVGPGASPG